MQPVHLRVRVGVFNCQQILAKISFVIFENVIKKQIECGLAWQWWNSNDLGLIDMFLINLNAEIVACILSFRKSRHKPNLESTSKYGFSPDLGGNNGSVLSMRMQVILDSSFARPGSAPIWGGKKVEFRDWTTSVPNQTDFTLRINTFLVGKILLLFHQKTALSCVLIFFQVEIKWPC